MKQAADYKLRKELLFEGYGSLYHIANVRKPYCIGDKVKLGNMARPMIITDIIVGFHSIQYRIKLNQ